ncbi:MAG: alkaline phosphatase family protein [Gemmatimonadota bacterium]
MPEAFRNLARPDSAPGEGDGVHLTFPHTLDHARSATGEVDFWTWWADRPALDEATLQLAARALAAEELGQDDAPDLLALSLSQTDRVGHAFGPSSLEQLDNLFRLDRALGAFLDRLDQTVGKGRYAVTLTSDHGSLVLPEVRAEQGLSGARLTRDSVAALQHLVNQAAAQSPDPQERARRLAEVVAGASWVARAWSHDELSTDTPADSFTVLQRHSYYPGRMAGLLSRAGVEIQLTEGTLTWNFPVGTTHGSPYHYDRHVPWIIQAPGVAPGTRDEAVSSTDVAPTLAGLLGLDPPDDLDGVDRLPKDPGPPS